MGLHGNTVWLLLHSNLHLSPATLLIVYIITEGDFHAMCKKHFQDVQHNSPNFGSSSNGAMIGNEAPRRLYIAANFYDSHKWITDSD
jgi:hypothetical protein